MVCGYSLSHSYSCLVDLSCNPSRNSFSLQFHVFATIWHTCTLPVPSAQLSNLVHKRYFDLSPKESNLKSPEGRKDQEGIIQWKHACCVRQLHLCHVQIFPKILCLNLTGGWRVQTCANYSWNIPSTQWRRNQIWSSQKEHVKQHGSKHAGSHARSICSFSSTSARRSFRSTTFWQCVKHRRLWVCHSWDHECEHQFNAQTLPVAFDTP